MINLRQQLHKILNKDCEFNWVVIRNMSNDECICRNQTPMRYNEDLKAYEPNPSFRTIASPSCPVCEGSGWIFEEYLFKCLSFYPGFRYSRFEDAQPAITASNLLTTYIYPDDNWEKIKVNDWLFDIRSNKEGNIKLPIERYRKWIVNDIPTPMRLDSNKVEFIKVYSKPAIL